MKYKAVIFDLFGTLIEKFPVDEAVAVLRQMAGVLKVDEDALTTLWFETFFERHSGTFGSLEDDIAWVTGKLGADPDPKQLKIAADLDIEYVRKNMVPKPGAEDLLAYLKQSGYKTGLVSNWSDEIPAIWDEIPLSRYFDATVFSCQARMMKPEPDIYRLALNELGVEPEECLYIGDGDSGEIAGASGVGMDAVLISDEDTVDWDGERITSLAHVPRFLSADGKTG